MVKNLQNDEKSALKLIINGSHYEWHLQYITGAEIKILGNLPSDVQIFLSIKKPGVDELINDNDTVDLARVGIEHFYSSKHAWKLVVDQKHFEWTQQFIKGAEVRHLGNIPSGFQIFLSINGPWEDELIEDADSVDLARPGIEQFYGCKPNTNNG